MSSGKKYQIIYADPPWKFNAWSDKGNGRSADNHYTTQSLSELMKMKISAICEDNAVLLMWATAPCLLHATRLGKAWGFQYKTIAFVWVKTNRNNGKTFMGMGYYTRSNAELVLLFTRGKPLKRNQKNIRQVLISPRTEHSRKPAEIRQYIVELFGDISRIELFARDPSDSSDTSLNGWDVFGNEVQNSIIIN